MSVFNNGHILIIDDDPYVLESVSTLLQEYGSPVIACGNREDYKQRLEDTVRQQTQEIYNLSREVIRRLTSVAEFRDSETGAHIARIGLYANKIAESLNMSMEFINAITYASSLHDIGKIGIPDKILLKPGSFTPEEFEVMKAG